MKVGNVLLVIMLFGLVSCNEQEFFEKQSFGNEDAPISFDNGSNQPIDDDVQVDIPRDEQVSDDDSQNNDSNNSAPQELSLCLGDNNLISNKSIVNGDSVISNRNGRSIGLDVQGSLQADDFNGSEIELFADDIIANDINGARVHLKSRGNMAVSDINSSSISLNASLISSVQDLNGARACISASRVSAVSDVNGARIAFKGDQNLRMQIDRIDDFRGILILENVDVVQVGRMAGIVYLRNSVVPDLGNNVQIINF